MELFNYFPLLKKQRHLHKKRFMLLMGFLLTLTVSAQSSKPVIFAQFNNSARTGNIVANINYIESLPFDGMAVNIPQSWYLMNGEPIDYTSMYDSWLDPIDSNRVFKKYRHNYLATFVDKPADFFDDWTVTIENFRKMARAAKAAGFVGIIFDNEEYYRHLWNYPDDVNYKSRTLAEYQVQARLRGKQIMEAMASEFPNIKVLVLHGPYLSEPKTPGSVLLAQAADASYYELLGPFFVGLVDGKGSSAEVTDGGEVYQYRSKEDFQHSYQWRKYDIASSVTNSAFIPPALRPDWPAKVSCSFGVYNVQWKDNYPMNAGIMNTTLTNALQRSDNAVWFFVDGADWLQPNGMPQDWITAVQTAKTAAGPYVAPPSTAGNLLVNPGFESGYTAWYDWGNNALSPQLRSGANALQAGAGGRGQIVQGLKANTAYRLSGWGKLGAANAGNAYIGIQFKNASNAVIVNYTATITGTAYSEKTVSFTSPASFAYAEVYVWKDAGSALVHVDDFDLREAGSTTSTDTTDPLTGTLTARGENGTHEAKGKAFDNDIYSKWLDFSPAANRASWIQYNYPSGEKYIVTQYTLTSANDAPERDPKDCTLYGVKDDNTLQLLDTRTGITFSSRNQKQSFSFTNTAAYKGYRLEINAVANPAAANSVQLTEVELIGSRASARLRAQSTPESAVLQAYPNPASESVTLTLQARQAQTVVVSLVNGQGVRAGGVSKVVEAGNHALTLPLKGYPKGWYLVQVTIDNQTQVAKLVIH